MGQQYSNPNNVIRGLWDSGRGFNAEAAKQAEAVRQEEERAGKKRFGIAKAKRRVADRNLAQVVQAVKPVKLGRAPTRAAPGVLATLAGLKLVVSRNGKLRPLKVPGYEDLAAKPDPTRKKKCSELALV